MAEPAHPLAPKDLSRAVGDQLRRRRETLAVAESCTGGALSDLVTSIPGSSDYFLGGVISYSPAVKENLLHIPHKTITRHGVVSRETALAMAQGVRAALNATWGIGITGVAGPGPDDAGNPGGLVFCAVASPAREKCERFMFDFAGHDDARVRVKSSAAIAALRMLFQELQTSS